MICDERIGEAILMNWGIGSPVLWAIARRYSGPGVIELGEKGIALEDVINLSGKDPLRSMVEGLFINMLPADNENVIRGCGVGRSDDAIAVVISSSTKTGMG